MIDKNTPYKLAEIIRDTWPQLYYLKEQKKENKNDNEYTSNSTKGVV